MLRFITTMKSIIKRIEKRKPIFWLSFSLVLIHTFGNFSSRIFNSYINIFQHSVFKAVHFWFSMRNKMEYLKCMYQNSNFRLLHLVAKKIKKNVKKKKISRVIVVNHVVCCICANVIWDKSVFEIIDDIHIQFKVHCNCDDNVWKYASNGRFTNHILEM